MAIHSSILAWEILWTEEPGGLQSMGSQRVKHTLATKQQAGDCLGLEAMGLRYGVSFWGEENALRLLVENSCEYTKNHVYSFE